MKDLSKSNAISAGVLVALLVLCSGVGFTQEDTASKDQVSRALAQLQTGSADLVAIQAFATYKVFSAIPGLKKEFATIQDSSVKDGIASVLVRLGDKDPVYWEFVVKEAEEAIDSDMPAPIGYDNNGEMSSKIPDRLTQWAAAHQIQPTVARDQGIFKFPGQVIELAVIGDQRAKPLLTKGLLSSSYIIAAVSARGLAKIGDKSSIALILAACERNPRPAASWIANAFLYFDDPVAQAAADRFIPASALAMIPDRKAFARHGPF